MTISTTGQTGNPYGVVLFPVRSPSGAIFQVQTQDEEQWYESRRDLYLQHNHLINISDLEDLDRLLTFELMVHRWSTWSAQGFDYQYARIEETALKNNIREFSVEIRQIKASLGMDKVSRDKDKGENFGDYLKNFLDRAKEFGYSRNKQYEEAVNLMWELHAWVRLYKRCDETERQELDLSLEKFLEWVDDNILRKWDAMNDAYRKNQAIWVRDPGAAIIQPQQQVSTQVTAMPALTP